MPRKDLYHDKVVGDLEREGWTITDDPLRLAYGGRNLYIDLGAENVLGATKGERQIAIEIKSFASLSDLADLENALGQYVLYRDILSEVEPERQLYLAIPRFAYESTFRDQFGQLVIAKQRLRVIVFEVSKEESLQWIE